LMLPRVSLYRAVSPQANAIIFPRRYRSRGVPPR
jgi:hypothetical protein